MSGFDFNLGETDTGSSGSPAAATFTLTTSHLASANTRVVVTISYFAGASPQRVTGVTVGGSAATLDIRAVNSNGQDVIDVWSLPVAGGLASSSAITATFGGTAPSGVGGVLLGAVSLSGVDMTNGGGVAGTGSSTSQSGTSWSSGTASAAGGIAVGGAGNESSSTSIGGSMTSGTKVHDNWSSGAGQGFQDADIVAETNVAGSFASSSTASTGAIVAYTAGLSTADAGQPFAREYPSSHFGPF